ncbi:hypothetical protein [Providencia stuartii]|uniref:hypothetical protein n=1 Tax=Providencia stuartii TaxID=588 RepID=UPI0038577C68
MQRIENNKVPNIETISALSSVFNVSVSELASMSLVENIELDNQIAEIRKRVKMKLRTYPKRILLQTMMAQARCSIAS